MNEAVCILMKYPEEGKVKTRLAETAGREAALRVYSELCRKTLAEADKTGREVFVFVEPKEKIRETAELFGIDGNIFPQSSGDLGERMYRAFARIFLSGCDSAVLIGTDIPELDSVIMEEAFDRLYEEDAVICPAEDGGYCLIGFRKETIYSSVFTGIEWSSPSVLKTTLEKLSGYGLRCALLKELCDIDTEEDLKKYIKNNSGSETAQKLKQITEAD
jgi:rSAM/selenodomain-associated transferase 1